jgi:NTP pyrophosphatase (non-canonical NTP hydrolase)
MAQLNLPPPETFDFRAPEKWPAWKRRFERYRSSCQLDEESDERQVSTLLYCLGEEADEILATIKSNDHNPQTEGEETEEGAPAETYKSVIDKLEKFFGVRKNTIFERARFNRRTQLQGETAEQYIMALYKLAEDCNYGELKSEVIRDRLVVGIHDANLSERLQLDPNLTLETAKKAIRQREAVKEQQKELSTSTATCINEVHSNHRQVSRNSTGTPRSGAGRPTNFINTHTPNKCTRCGKEAHKREFCPAKDAKCYRCGKTGHFSSQCLTRNVAEVRHHDDSDQSDSDQDFVLSLNAITNTHQLIEDNYWKATVALNEVFKIDTGAEVTAISEKAYHHIGSSPLQTSSIALNGPAKHSLEVMGQFTGTLQYKKRSSRETIYVIRGLQSNLLGLPAISSLKLALRINQVERPIDWVKRYHKVFTGLGTMVCDIKLKPNSKLYAIFSPRQVPLSYRKKTEEELLKMDKLGVISRVEEPTEWCSGMVPVPKRDGSIRVCVDLRPLNENVMREVFSLPRVDDLLAQLSGAKLFSKLDANLEVLANPFVTRISLINNLPNSNRKVLF